MEIMLLRVHLSCQFSNLISDNKSYQNNYSLLTETLQFILNKKKKKKKKKRNISKLPVCLKFWWNFTFKKFLSHNFLLSSRQSEI